ncbi:MAG: AtpZ/AtpI family protein [Deltaproteobacteria bacterium]|nr:AtpZ/AtpI family protein [Deltaproteobacteria bacterium]
MTVSLRFPGGTMQTRHSHQNTMSYTHILTLSAWGFAIVIASFLFLYVGYWLDELFRTSPTFMIGLFLLAVFFCIGRFYREAWLKRERW